MAVKLKTLFTLVETTLQADMEFTLVNSKGDMLRFFPTNDCEGNITIWYHPVGKKAETGSYWSLYLSDAQTMRDFGLDPDDQDWGFSRNTFEWLKKMINQIKFVYERLQLYRKTNEK